MRTYAVRCSLVAVAVPYLLVAAAHAGGPVGTAFTYQGQLKLSGVPVSDTCDFVFALWDDPVASLPANQVGPTLIFDTGNLPPIEVVNGLFEVALDFGSNVFNGDARWLEIAVCCPSPCATGFTTLTPRQELTPTPYALFALNGGSGGDGHSLDAADGVPVDALFVDNDGNVGIDNKTPTEKLDVNGNIKASGTIQSGNSITIDGTAGSEKIISTDAIEFHTSGGRALRLEPAGPDDGPNVIAGFSGNSATAGVVGSTIAGGGAAFDQQFLIVRTNRVTDNYGTVAGGRSNRAGDDAGTSTDACCATIGGGDSNLASGDSSTVGGGFGNAAVGTGSTVPGGRINVAGGDFSFAAGRNARIRDATQAGEDPATCPFNTCGDEGTFVWSDVSSTNIFASTGPNQFLIRAAGGVGIGTESPSPNNQLTVAGNADFSGNVGIGTTEATSRLHVVGDGQHVVFGENSITGAIAAVAVYGRLSSTSPGVGATAVRGENNSTGGITENGVWGSHDGNGTGVLGTTVTGRGVEGRTVSGYAGFFTGGKNYFEGNVGIGTLFPSSQLSVDGNADFSGNVGIGTTAPETSLDTERVRIRNGGSAPTTGAGLELLYDGTRAQIFAIDRDGDTFPNLVLQPQPDGGNVGIGTTSPLARLHVQGDGNDQLLLQGELSAPFLHFRKNVNGSDWVLRHDDGKLHFQTESPPTADREVLTIVSTKRLGIGNTAPDFPLHVGTPGTNGNGAHVTNGGMWTNGSDRNSKKNFTPVDRKDILAKVANLPITEWRYKGEPDSVRHIGPVAQDFYVAFGLGESDKHIGTIDADGVALAAIQGLHKLVQEKDGRIDALHEEIASMSKRLARLESLFPQPGIQTGGTP